METSVPLTLESIVAGLAVAFLGICVGFTLMLLKAAIVGVCTLP